MAEQEVPIEGGEWACAGAGFLSWVVGTMAAVVAHALDVFSGSTVRFGGHDAAICELGHAEGVGEFDPLDGVDKDGEVPFVHRLGTNTEEEGIETGDHEALDVVSIPRVEGLADHLGEAVHRSMTGPVEVRERLVCSQSILLEILGHVEPVDAANVFSPAEDLANEPLGGGEGGFAFTPGLLCGINDFTGMEKFEVESCGNEGVVEVRFAGPHGILMIAEVRESLFNEVSQAGECGATRDGPSERIQ